ncbi:hypothetical protein ACFFHO_12945 [Enterococcus canintestini]|uniref:hypothetical protein n=1 Tax=Enterococcus canintestini TaxID=317010 RepID=UPI00200F0C4D|nr:hypothetical protein [Enterococcus canintestini]
MSDLHSIKLLLGIKDKNIQITHVEKKKYIQSTVSLFLLRSLKRFIAVLGESTWADR